MSFKDIHNDKIGKNCATFNFWLECFLLKWIIRLELLILRLEFLPLYVILSKKIHKAEICLGLTADTF